jgi:YD repeat-containing protein
VTDGDPVATARGEYILTLLERTLGGPLPLGFGRYFASFAGIPVVITNFYGPFDSPMGANWVHNFLLLLRRTNSDNVRIYYYKSRVIHFRRSGTTWTMIHPAGIASYKGTPYQMVEEGGKLKLMDPEMNLICTFDFQGLPIGGVRGVESIQDRQGNTHRLTYNPDGTLKRVEDGLGRSFDLTYITSASRPRISRVTDQAGRSLQYEYEGAQLVSFTDARGQVTRYTYDSRARLESITRPRSNTFLRNSYRPEDGVVVSQTDGTGNTTQFAYAGRFGQTAIDTTITDPLGQTVTHHFDQEFQLIGMTDEAGKRSQYENDDFHRRTATIDRLGDRSTLTYDLASGKVTSRTDNEGKTWTYTYTPQEQGGFTFHNLTRINYPDGTQEQFDYDGRGNIVRRVDRAGKVWMASYNSRGQVLTLTNPEGGVTTDTYNPDGTTASVQDPAGNTTTFDYDQFKRLSRINRPDATSAVSTRVVSHLASVLLLLGGAPGLPQPVLRASLSTLARWLGISQPGREPAQASANRATVQFSYDPNDNLLSRTNENGQTTRYTYDANDNLETFTNALGHTWTMAYDANDNLTTITDPLGKSARIT